MERNSQWGPTRIRYFVNENDICNYADDNTLSVADVEIEQIVKKLEVNIEILNSWFTNNAMVLNEDKCQFLIVESPRVIRNETTTLSIGNKVIEEGKNKTSWRYLR